MKKFAFLAVAAALVFAGCDKSDDPTDSIVLVESVELNESALSLFEGAEATLVATVKPENATNKSVKWESNNPTVATVADGKVTAVKEGSATITVTTEDGAKTAECNITVKQKVNFTVTLDAHEIDAKAGEGLTLTATVTPADAEYVVGWGNENPDAAVLVHSSKKNDTGVSIKKIAANEAAEVTITVSIIDPTDYMTVLATDTCKIYVNYHEYDDHFYYMGENYKFVALKDGNKWMAENLRYVPEGKTVSADPKATTGIWYAYTYDTDFHASEEASAKLGYLYDAAATFGVDALTADNVATFEGKQGICPKGWHIPTFAEWFALVGVAPKLTVAAAGYEAGTTPLNENALYYNTDYKGGKVSEMTDLNFAFAGTRNQTNSSFIKPLAGYETMPMTYLWASTLYKSDFNADGSIKSLQFFSLGSTATKAYPEGRLTVMFDNYGNGCPVRCVKNK